MLPVVNSEENKQTHLSISRAQRVELLRMLQCGTSMKHITEGQGVGTREDLEKERNKLLKDVGDVEKEKKKLKKKLHTVKPKYPFIDQVRQKIQVVIGLLVMNKLEYNKQNRKLKVNIWKVVYKN